MNSKRLSKVILKAVLGLLFFNLPAATFHPHDVYAADTSGITTTSTRSEVQEIVDEGRLDRAQLTDAEIDHIYALYNNDPETLRQLQKQSDSVTTYGRAKLSSTTYGRAKLSSTTYTHASQFKNSTIVMGIDVSEWNGSINWSKVKASGVSFAFIRAGGRYYGSGAYFTDSRFAENVKNATAAGIDVGAYFYSQAISSSEAKQEATYILNIVSSYNINLPIVMDFEYAWEDGLTGRLYNANLSKSAATTIINTFCSTVESKGYVGMLYASKSVITDDMNVTSVNNKYPIWNAQYNNSDTLTATHSYWQYSDSGSVSGISYPTDLDFKYIRTPAAPASLSPKSSTDSSITLTWEKVPEVYGYQIVRYDESKEKYVSIGTVKGAGTLTYTDKDLQEGQRYTYKVRGYYKLNSGTVYGTYSSECSCIASQSEAGLASSDPGPVNGLKISAAYQDYITIKWNKLSNIDGYIIYTRFSSSDDWSRIGKITSADTVTYTHSSLSASTSHSSAVRAYYKVAGTYYYTDYSASVTGYTGPSMPSQAAIVTRTASSINIRWSKITGATGYFVYSYNTSTGTYDRIARCIGDSSRTYTFSGLSPATVYKFGVRAYYEHDGVTSYSNRLEFSKCTKPRTFTTSYKYTKLGSYRYLQWQKLSNASGYIIYKYDIAGNKYTRVKKLSSYKTTSCILPALKSGYGYRILAYKKYNSTVVYGDISQAPTKVSPLNGTVIDSQVRLRSGAGTGKSIILELARGSKVKVTGYTISGKDGWYKVTYTKNSKTYTGYMFADYIRIN